MRFIVANFIREWLKDIVVLFVIISLVEIIVPKGSMKRYVDFIIGIIIIFTVISPFNRMINFEYNFDKEIDKFQSEISSTDSILSTQDKQIEEVFKKRMENELINFVHTSTDYNIKDVTVKMKTENNVLMVAEVDIYLDKGRESDIRIDKVSVGDGSIEIFNEKEDYSSLKAQIGYFVQLDEQNINIYKE